MNLAGKTLRRSAKSPGVCRSHHLSSFIHSPTDTLGHRHRSAPGTTLPDGPAKRGPTTGSPKIAPNPRQRSEPAYGQAVRQSRAHSSPLLL